MRKSSLAIGLFLACVPAVCFGYSNDGEGGGPHRKINEYALEQFALKAQKDPILSLYDFYPTIDKYGLPKSMGAAERPFTVEYETVIHSGPWYKDDKLKTPIGLETYQGGMYMEEGKRWDYFPWWIVEGGYTADEPEAYMALRHFYDPKNKAEPYLTDLIGKPLAPGAEDKGLGMPTEPSRFVNEVGQHPSLMGANPGVNARDWALYGSRHSFADLSKSLGAAEKMVLPLENREPLLGKAWRSIGETMHLLADMTVPAHVRNDGHPGYGNAVTWLMSKYSHQYDVRTDPYEDYVTAGVVDRHAKSAVEKGIAKAIGEAFTPRDLFERVALWTSENFFSLDTISGRDLGTKKVYHSYNEQPDHAAPKLENMLFKDGYHYREDSLGEVLMAFRDAPNQPQVIDRRVAFAQASRLIPAAIAADARLLELTIPRYGVVVDGLDIRNKTLRAHAVRYSADKDGSFDPNAGVLVGAVPTTRGHALVRLTAGGESKVFWKELVSIKAGSFEASLAGIPSIKLDSYLDARPDNPATADLKIAVGMDVGGIVVWSRDWSPVSLVISPAEIELDATSAASFKAEVVGAAGKAVVWSVREKDGGVIGADGSYGSPEKPGVYHVEAWLKDDPSVRAEAKVKVEVKEASQVAAPKPVKDDRGWKEAVESLYLHSYSELSDKEAALGARYGLTWDKDIRLWHLPHKSGTWTKTHPDGRKVSGTYWTRFQVHNNVAVSMNWDWSQTGKAVDGVFPQALASVESVFKRAPAAKPAGLGDISYVRAYPSGSVDIEVWRGPVSVSFTIDAASKIGPGAGQYGPEYSPGPESEAEIKAAVGETAAKNSSTAAELAGRVLAALDAWYTSPVADGPGIKGLFYPVCEGFSLSESELPEGLEMTKKGVFGGKDCSGTAESYEDSFTAIEKGSSDNPSKEPNTYNVRWRAIGFIAAEESAAGPSTKAAEWYQGAVRDFSAGSPSAFAQAKPIALPGTDEAVEAKANPVFRYNNRCAHAIVMRKANVVVVVDGRYYAPAYKPQSDFGLELARRVLAKLSPGKTAAQPKPAPAPAVAPAPATEEKPAAPPAPEKKAEQGFDVEKALQMFQRQ
ncbi:MAG: hypothetical protein WC943_03325 [Elusimicrobiota bacterium]|jgi:hypothetical protein